MGRSRLDKVVAGMTSLDRRRRCGAIAVRGVRSGVSFRDTPEADLFQIGTHRIVLLSHATTASMHACDGASRMGTRFRSDGI